MKTANFFAVYMLMALMLFCFSGCKGKDNGNNNQSSISNNAASVEYKDGEYTASAATFDDSGYRSTVTVVIKDGAVSTINCDAEKKGGGTKKADSENGIYNMKQGGAQYEWHEEIAIFESFVRENGIDSVTVNSNGKTDIITGCTISVSEYIKLINDALGKAKK